ncbi:MAG: TetR/AcrR family transcriptional regulator [Pseudomonadota bacterium]
MTKTKRNTRKILIDTAIDLIWQAGYSSVSVDEICKNADVRKGSFYHFFPSKVDLAVAAMDKAFQEFRPIMDEAFSSNRPPLERFEKLANDGLESQKMVAEQYGRVCGCPFVTLGAEMAPQDETIRLKTDEIINHHKQYYEQALIDLVQEGSLPADTDVKTKANKIHSFIMGQLVMARIQNSLEPLGNELITGMFRMIGAKEKVAA